MKEPSAELNQAETDLASMQHRLNRRVVDIYKSGDMSLLDVLLEAELQRQQVHAEQTETARQAKSAAGERAHKAFLASRSGKVVESAMRFLGAPYVCGGAGTLGFGRSGLVQYVHARVGVSLSPCLTRAACSTVTGSRARGPS